MATVPSFSWSKATKSAIQEVVVHVIEIIVIRNLGAMAPQIGIESVPKCVSGERRVAVTSVQGRHNVSRDGAGAGRET